MAAVCNQDELIKSIYEEFTVEGSINLKNGNMVRCKALVILETDKVTESPEEKQIISVSYDMEDIDIDDKNINNEEYEESLDKEHAASVKHNIVPYFSFAGFPKIGMYPCYYAFNIPCNVSDMREIAAFNVENITNVIGDINVLDTTQTEMTEILKRVMVKFREEIIKHRNTNENMTKYAGKLY